MGFGERTCSIWELDPFHWKKSGSGRVPTRLETRASRNCGPENHRDCWLRYIRRPRSCTNRTESHFYAAISDGVSGDTARREIRGFAVKTVNVITQRMAPRAFAGREMDVHPAENHRNRDRAAGAELASSREALHQQTRIFSRCWTAWATE